jgi:hypothetical protein
MDFFRSANAVLDLLIPEDDNLPSSFARASLIIARAVQKQ